MDNAIRPQKWDRPLRPAGKMERTADFVSTRKTSPRILFLAHRVPYPPNRGDRIRSFHLLRFLASRATVDLAFCCEKPPTTATIEALNSLCDRVLAAPLGRCARWFRGAASMVRGRTVTEGLFHTPRLERTIRRWAAERRYAAVFAFCSSMAPYTRAPEFAGVPAVVDLVDVDSQKWLDYAARTRGWRGRLLALEGSRLRQLEAELPRQAAAVLLVSEAETALFRTFSPAENVYAIGNGVDLDYFRAQPSARRMALSGSEQAPIADTAEAVPDQVSPRASAGQAEVPPSCLFVGALDYQANLDGLVWFCREVWPQVCRKLPSARFSIVGSNPSPAALRLREIEGVELVGPVDDVRPHLAAAHCVAVPLRIARGIQNKVLEAMAAGRAVVASPQALEGLAAEPGGHVLRAAEPPEWVDTLTRLLVDGSLRERLGAAGRRYVETHHDWQVQLEPMFALPGLECLRPPVMRRPQLAAQTVGREDRE